MKLDDYEMNKTFGLVAFVFALTTADGGRCHAEESQAKPNVLLIITDDQGYGDFSIHGNPHLQTPNIDGLARGLTLYTLRL